MSGPIEVSSIIPTRNRAPALRECLSHLAGQTIDPDRHEVIVVIDGPDPDSTGAVRGFETRLRIRLIEADRLGIAHAKNEGLAASRGRLIVLLNDDVLPAPGFLEAHIAARAALTRPAMIVGYSPFLKPASGDSLFDRLIRETSMVFFYDRMIGPDRRPTAPPGHDWGFRHAWNLNLSLSSSAALAAGGFRPAIANCCYEDIEFAHRLGDPVLFLPEAFAPHDHRYTPDGYLDREFRLGYSAYGFAHAAPECAKSVFHLDLRATTARENALRLVEKESVSEPLLLEEFRGLANKPAGSVNTAGVAGLFERFRVLKRLAFSRGLLAAIQGERVGGLFHPDDGLSPDAPLLAARAA